MADLCRCNAVSKHWQRRLIPSANSLRPLQLGLLHLNNLNEPSTISNILGGNLLITSFKTGFLDDINMFVRYLAVCNGLLLLHLENRDEDSEILLVRNPESGRITGVRLPPQYSCDGFHFLVFDSRLSYSHFMIIYWMKEGAGAQRIYLYSSKTSQWEDMDLLSRLLPSKLQIDYEMVGCYLTGSCCLDGIAYMIAGQYDGVDYDQQKNIIAFEVEKKRLFFIPSPTMTAQDNSGRKVSMGEFGGRLGYVCYDTKSFILMAWVLEGDEWILRHTVNLCLDFGNSLPNWPRSLVSFAFHPSDGEVLFVNFDTGLHKLNLNTKEHYRRPLRIHKDGNAETYSLSYHDKLLYPFLWS